MEENRARSCIALIARTQSYTAAERTSNTTCFRRKKRFQQCAGVYILICKFKFLKFPPKSLPRSSIKRTQGSGVFQSNFRKYLCKETACTPCLPELFRISNVTDWRILHVIFLSSFLSF